MAVAKAIGEVWVDVRPNLLGVSNQINQQFAGMGSAFGQPIQQAITQGANSAGPAVAAAGQQAGSGFGEKFKAGLKTAALGTAAVLAVAGAGAVAAMGTAMEKESGNAKMTAALGLDPETAKKAGEVAGNLYVGAYGESLGDTQNATAAVISSFTNMRQASSSEIEEVTKRALNMASVFEVDVPRAAQVASQMVTNGFAKDATGAFDLLSATMSRVPANVREDIMDAVDEYGPFMKQVGLEGAKGMEILIKQTEKGAFGTDKFGDSVKELSLQVLDAAKNGPLIEKMGLDYQKVATGFVNGGADGAKAFDSLISGILKIEDPLERANTAVSLFGTPLEDLNTSEIPMFLKSLQSTSGGLGDVTQAALDMDATLGNTADATLTSFKRTVEMTFADAVIPLVHELQPMLKDAGQWFKDNQGDITEWVNVIFDGFTNVIVPAVQTVMPYFQEMFTWLADNQEALQQWVPVLINVGAALGALTIGWQVGSAILAISSAVKVAAVAFWGAATASTAFGISVAPLLLLGAAVFALGYGIGTVLTSVVGNFGAVRDTIFGFFGSIADGFTNLTSGTYDALGAIGGAIMGLGALIANIFIGWMNMVPYAVNAMLIGINGIFDVIPGMSGVDVPMMQTIPYMEWNVPALATGADVMGPTLALVGEKDPETVVNRGLMNKNLELQNERLEAIEGGGGDIIEITINPSAGMDEKAIADAVIKQLEYRKKRRK